MSNSTELLSCSIAGMGKPWTEEEKAVLRDTSLSLAEVAAKIGRPRSAVAAKAHLLGVKRQAGPVPGSSWFIPEPGHRFDRLVVIEPGVYVRPAKQRVRYAHVRCDCGVVKEVVLGALLRGAVRSCGCLNQENRLRPRLAKRKLLVRQGDVFGYLTVIGPEKEPATFGDKKYRMVGVRCACGTELDVIIGNLFSGRNVTCGCRFGKIVWDRSDPDWQWRQYLWTSYHITSEQYLELLEKQGGRCAVCKKFPGKHRLHVDHDHSCCSSTSKSCGKCVRGLLCFVCNTMLGKIELLQDAVSTYLGKKVLL